VAADAVELLDSIIEMDGPDVQEDIRRLEEFERTGIAVPGAEVKASPWALSADEVAELDRRWAAIEAGDETISNDAILRWLRMWGSPTLNRCASAKGSDRTPTREEAAQYRNSRFSV
jgi:hypothetical protein